jgi:hypothetical protein
MAAIDRLRRPTVVVASAAIIPDLAGAALRAGELPEQAPPFPRTLEPLRPIVAGQVAPRERERRAILTLPVTIATERLRNRPQRIAL